MRRTLARALHTSRPAAVFHSEWRSVGTSPRRYLLPSLRAQLANKRANNARRIISINVDLDRYRSVHLMCRVEVALETVVGVGGRGGGEGWGRGMASLATRVCTCACDQSHVRAGVYVRAPLLHTIHAADVSYLRSNDPSIRPMIRLFCLL